MLTLFKKLIQMVRNMKIELGRREYWLIIAIVGVLFSHLSLHGGSYVSELDVFGNLTIVKEQSINAQSLGKGRDPPNWDPINQYIYESIDFEVNIFFYNTTSGTLEINFTRDNKVLRKEYVWGPTRILLSGYGEYRFRYSNFDVTLRALDEDVRVKFLIDIIRRTREYSPILSMFFFMGLFGVIILEIGSKVLSLYKKRT